MSQCMTTMDDLSKDEIYRCLGDHRRRRLLAVVADRPSPVPVDDLAARLADDPRGESSLDRRSVLIDLRHAQLPTLDDAGLIEWDRDAATVALATDALDDPAFQTHLEHLESSWDPIVSALAHRDRRRILSIVAGRRTPIGRDRLARTLADRAGEHDPSTTDRIATALAHTHLPTLVDAGLLAAVDEDGGTRFRVDPDFDERLRGECPTSRLPRPVLAGEAGR